VNSLFDATCRTLLAPYLPRGFTLPQAVADTTPAALAVAWSYWAEWAGCRRWLFPSGGALLGLDRERFEIVRDALVRHFAATGRAMGWMKP
jgi:hypothetical protein